MKRKVFLLSLLSFGFPPAAFAQIQANPVIDLNKIIQEQQRMANPADPANSAFAKFISIGAFISALLPYIYGFAGIALFLLLIKGGFSMLTSAGDPKKTESAKGELTAAIVGFLIVITAFWITQIMATVLNLQYKGTNFF